MSHAANADAAGSFDYATQLSITEVVDNATKEQSTRVLYASLIDKDTVSKQIDDLYALTSENGGAVSSSTLIGENDSMMSLTNSSRFYTGEVAVAQFAAMGEVNVKINDLLSKIDAIYNNKDAILKKIDSYNESLLELKKDCRLKLLQDAADVWNAKKQDLPGFPTIHKKELTYPNTKSEWGWHKDQVIFKEATDINEYIKETPPDSGNYIYYYDYKWHEYNIIQYWRGFKSIKLFSDPGFEEVEVMFNNAGAPLPYEPSLILPKSE